MLLRKFLLCQDSYRRSELSGFFFNIALNVSLCLMAVTKPEVIEGLIFVVFRIQFNIHDRCYKVSIKQCIINDTGK